MNVTAADQIIFFDAVLVFHASLISQLGGDVMQSVHIDHLTKRALSLTA